MNIGKTGMFQMGGGGVCLGIPPHHPGQKGLGTRWGCQGDRIGFPNNIFVEILEILCLLMEYSQHLPQKTRIQMYTAHHSQAILNHGLWGVIRIPKVVQGVRIVITLPYGGFPDFHTPSKTLLNINTVVSAMFADLLLQPPDIWKIDSKIKKIENFYFSFFD